MRLLDERLVPTRGLSFASAIALGFAGLLALAAARAQDPVERPRATQSPPEAAVVAPSSVVPSATDSLDLVLDQGTTWILREQAENGRWIVRGKDGAAWQGEHNEIHVTAIAMRALMNQLGGERDTAIENAVLRGAEWITLQQREDGCFGPLERYLYNYGHAQAMRSLIAVQTRWPSAARLEQIERGLIYIYRCRNPYKAWRYNAHPDGDNDTKISSMMLLAIHDAKKLDLDVDSRAIEGGMSWLDEMTHAVTGRVGFNQIGSASARLVGKNEDYPGTATEEMTALALMTRLAYGQSPAKSKLMRRSIELLLESLPEWSVRRGTIDYSYWNFGSQAFAHLGGYQAEAWNDALLEELIPRRLLDATGAAHWPATDAWSNPGLEVYSTATALLALQATR